MGRDLELCGDIFIIEKGGAKLIYFGITNRNRLCYGRGLPARTFGAQRPMAINAHTSRVLSPDLTKAEL